MSQDNAVAEAPVASHGKIVCHIDNARVHSIQTHIRNHYPNEWTIERYQEEFPDQPLLSEYAKEVLARKAAERAEQDRQSKETVQAQAAATGHASSIIARSAFFNDVFEFGDVPAAMGTKGKPIPIKVLDGHDSHSLDYLPDVDKNYVFNIDLVKKVIVGFELNMPIYLWGYHGTGKTTVLQQAAARTRRPFIRVQHTINMQESDVLGQWTVKNGQTEFQLGPLAIAMINGWVYCADEYDFAMPSVTAVYQPVLEGESLLIKDAPPTFRKIVPHENFRFCATGNTNGIGDETGLYQGTLIQNAANYSRFKITEEVVYMEPKIEESVLISRTRIDRASAAKIVKLGNAVREMFRDGKLSMTISPRELISCAQIGIAYGANWSLGMELAFANRLSRVDRQVMKEYMQRSFTA